MTEPKFKIGETIILPKCNGLVCKVLTSTANPPYLYTAKAGGFLVVQDIPEDKIEAQQGGKER